MMRRMLTAVESQVEDARKKHFQLKDRIHIRQRQGKIQIALSLPADGQFTDDFVFFHGGHQAIASRSNVTEKEDHPALDLPPRVFFLKTQNDSQDSRRIL